MCLHRVSHFLKRHKLVILSTASVPFSYREFLLSIWKQKFSMTCVRVVNLKRVLK